MLARSPHDWVPGFPQQKRVKKKREKKKEKKKYLFFSSGQTDHKKKKKGISDTPSHLFLGHPLLAINLTDASLLMLPASPRAASAAGPTAGRRPSTMVCPLPTRTKPQTLLQQSHSQFPIHRCSVRPFVLHVLFSLSFLISYRHDSSFVRCQLSGCCTFYLWNTPERESEV